jgi:DNA-binding HxlR family transcriptional regulator
MNDASDCVAGWCVNDDWCPITCASEILARKWNPVIINRLLEDGPLRFNELSASLDELSNSVLSESLDELTDNDIVDRTIVNEKPIQVEYALTNHGRRLQPAIEALEDWGDTYLQSASQ